MPNLDGIALARRLSTLPGTVRIVLMSAAFTHAALQDAVAAGISAFASKLAPADELVDVVLTAAKGHAAMTSDVVPMLAASTDPGRPAGRLSDRERDVVQALANRQTVEEIAGSLHLSPHTVRNHIRRAMAHLGVHRRLDAVVVAAQAGLIRLPE